MRLENRDKASKPLIAEFQRGDANAFEQIYLRFQAPLAAFVRARSRGLCESAVEEIVQETFLRAFRFRESYREEFELSTWLWSIARNALLDHLGRIPPENQDPAPAEGEPDPSDSAETGLIRRAEIQRLLGFFKRLPTGQRRALFLRIVRQLSYEEIAQRTQVSLSAVKSLMNRAKYSLVSEWRLSLGTTESQEPKSRLIPDGLQSRT